MKEKPLFEHGGFVKLNQIIGSPPGTGPIPISKALWYKWIKEGKAPKPIRLGGRAVAWRADEINRLVAKLSTRR